MSLLPRLDRQFKPDELRNATGLGRQIEGWADMPAGQQDAILNKARDMKLLRLPGSGDAAGNTIRGGGGYIQTPGNFYDHLSDLGPQMSSWHKGNPWLKPLEDLNVQKSRFTDGGKSWMELLDLTKKKWAEDGAAKPAPGSPQPMPHSFGEIAARQPGAEAPFKPAPGFNDLVARFPKASSAPARSSTLSPGIGLDGKPINYSKQSQPQSRIPRKAK